MKEQLPLSTHHIRESLFVLSIKLVSVLIAFHLIKSALLLVASLGPENFFWAMLGAPGGATRFYFLSAVNSLLSIVEGFLIVFIALWRESNSFYFSENRLIHYYGISGTHERIYELAHIRSVTLDQSWLGKMFHYGNLKVTLAVSGYHEEIILRGIVDPKKYERVLCGFIPKS